MRTERDSMGGMDVPDEALWGASTQRAVGNFPISGRGLPGALIHALALVKQACATVNQELGRLTPAQARAIVEVCGEIVAGKLDAHFPVDVYQTGSGTSTNMNLNEVIANRAAQRAGKPVGDRTLLHPNDHVNMGQSSNDVFPTAMHVAGALAVHGELLPALARVQTALEACARKWDGVVTVGRTHLMDAVPIRLGQIFSGYAAQIAHARRRGQAALEALERNLPIGGTAVGTGINTPADFGRRVGAELSRMTGLSLQEAENHFAAQAAKDSIVSAHAELKTIAVSLTKIAGDMRLLGSGPRCGLGQLRLPATQPGSSIMPGKVNPVICESVMQVACRVIGNDAVVTTAGLGGVGSIFELNVAMPVMAEALLESICLLANVSNVMVDKLLTGLEADAQRCERMVEQSLMMVTSLAPVLGYDQAAQLAKAAAASGRTIRELVRERKLLDEATLARLLDARGLTEPGAEGGGSGG